MVGIYAIRNKDNDSLYIGSSVNVRKRWAAHRRQLAKGVHHAQPLQRAFAKYGADSFSFEIIEFVDDESVLIEREQLWMDFFKPKYNVCKIAGTPGSRPVSVATREKMSAAHKGRKRAPFTAEHKERISLSKRGKKQNLSPEVKEKIRVSHLGNKSFLGKKFTQEHRMNLSLSKIGNSNAKGFKYPAGAYDSRRGPRS